MVCIVYICSAVAKFWYTPGTRWCILVFWYTFIQVSTAFLPDPSSASFYHLSIVSRTAWVLKVGQHSATGYLSSGGLLKRTNIQILADSKRLLTHYSKLIQHRGECFSDSLYLHNEVPPLGRGGVLPLFLFCCCNYVSAVKSRLKTIPLMNSTWLTTALLGAKTNRGFKLWRSWKLWCGDIYWHII